MLNYKLRILYPEADIELFGLYDIGHGLFIHDWQQPFPQPTQEELDSVTQEQIDTLIAKDAVPKIVSMRQARLALLGAGLLSQIETTIASLPEPDRSAVQIEWEYAIEVNRTWPWVIQLSQALGLTDDQLDNLFIAASQL